MEKYLNRKVSIKKEFTGPGTFEAYYNADEWLRENGYSFGSACGSFQPIAIKNGEYNLPQKWKNFSIAEKKSVDGVLIGNLREGPMTVYIFLTDNN